jgi:hypothetical protein
MSERRCMTCEFFDGGLCRRNPPQMPLWPSDNQHPVMYAPCPSWPQVMPATDWCGEWRRKPDADAF